MSTMISNQVFWLVVVGAVLLWQCCVDGQNGGRNRAFRQRGRNRNNGQRRGGLSPAMQAAYLDAVLNLTTTPTPGMPSEPNNLSDPWRRYTPSLPAPNEVECYVSNVVTERHGGRCMRLGGQLGPYACQSGPLLNIFAECEGILNARNGKK